MCTLTASDSECAGDYRKCLQRKHGMGAEIRFDLAKKFCDEQCINFELVTAKYLHRSMCAAAARQVDRDAVGQMTVPSMRRCCTGSMLDAKELLQGICSNPIVENHGTAGRKVQAELGAPPQDIGGVAGPFMAH